jgi:hypothetical protein
MQAKEDPMTTITLGTPNIATDLSLPPQARKILAHLEKGKSITPMEAMIVYHISRLSDCILKIRRAGYNVQMDERKDEVGARYARYTLVR